MRKCIFLLFFPVALQAYGADAPAKMVNVLTDRTPSYLEPLVKQYEVANKVKINLAYVEEGLLSRLEARAKEDQLDLVISKDLILLELAKKAGLLRPFASPVIKQNIDGAYQEAQNFYTGLAYRARAIFYSKARVKPDQLSTYLDLADPKWKGKVCIRSAYHDYNLALFSQMAADIGIPKLKEFLTGLKANLARKPTGADRDQAKAIYQGKCDVALVNSYYMGIMMEKEDQKPWALATDIFFPGQGEKGSYVLTSGAALTKAGSHGEEALKFLEFLTAQEAQSHFSISTYEYPLNGAAKTHPLLATFGRGQKEVKEGHFAKRYIPLDKVIAQREEVIKLLDEINFDGR